MCASISVDVRAQKWHNAVCAGLVGQCEPQVHTTIPGGPLPPTSLTRNQYSHRARLGGRTQSPDPSTVAGAVPSLL